MKKQWKKWCVVLVSIFVVAVLISCELPFNITISPKTSATETLNLQTSASISDTTPSPGSQSATVPDTFLPATGSILRWVDFSDFVYVPSGEFIMGAESTESKDYAPAHTVNLNGFWIHQAEVTNQQYAQCVADGKCTVPNSDPNEEFRYGSPVYANFPVVGVSWNRRRNTVPILMHVFQPKLNGKKPPAVLKANFTRGEMMLHPVIC
jgi:hypothetical protein